MYVGKQTLNMCLASQRGIETNYKDGSSYMLDSIMEQSENLLKDLSVGTTELRVEDIDTAEALVYSYVKSASGSRKKEAIRLAEKLIPALRLRKENLKKLADINFVAYTLNNKKRAVKLSPEELVMAHKTIEADQENPAKLKQRLKQQLQSYALLKYSSLSKSELNSSDVAKNFVSVFGLAHKKQQQIKSSTKPQAAKMPETKTMPKRNSLLSGLKNFGHKMLNKLDRVRHNIKVFYYRNEYKIAALSFALIGFGTYKACDTMEKSELKYQQSIYQNSPEKADVSSTPDKTADFAQEQKKMQQSETQKTCVGESYYDTALLIHLKTKSAVQGLYDKIDSLHKAGKISFENGLDTKRYAHSFTMYNLIRPNSKENKAIQNLLNGGNENSDYIKNLVEKAGEKGTGVKPDNNSIKTSNFDMANSHLQLMHLKNLKNNARN